jgi:hypothetical protein
MNNRRPKGLELPDRNSLIAKMHSALLPLPQEVLLLSSNAEVRKYEGSTDPGELLGLIKQVEGCVRYFSSSSAQKESFRFEVSTTEADYVILFEGEQRMLVKTSKGV